MGFLFFLGFKNRPGGKIFFKRGGGGGGRVEGEILETFLVYSRHVINVMNKHNNQTNICYMYITVSSCRSVVLWS